MAVKKPLILNAGKVEEIKSPDTIDPSVLPASSGALIDGGAPSTNHTGNLRVDFGSPS